jgi:eukaryotic-like serine/threonine-protein kinase
MADWDPLVNAIFLRAIEAGSPTERVAILETSCRDDAELRRKVEALLRAHDGAGSFLDRPAPELAADLAGTATLAATRSVPVPAALAGLEATEALSPDLAPADGAAPRPIAEGPGTRIGPYKLLQEIGEGGMGTVYMAEQERPVRRQVALKLIKPGMDSRSVLARFDSERQALALMDHPNIARVFDAGSTDSGRPYFVMELVRGIPLTDYCDQNRLGLPERLALFRPICSALQHAHQKGIIHRDLKPTNILVESHDGRPVPKVIDFGLAKATGGMRLTEQSLFTAFGGVAGTPLYMAPEQATLSALDIDTRADIYALGVILYELLTGSTPITRDSIQSAALDEMLRVIREVDPPTPSSRISTSEALPSLAASRQVEPARLSRMVRGELDWIVMKALAKERERRYDSAIGLADDIERYLDHQPVSAGPPTAAYRLRKFIRRHRIPVTAAALVLLALVLGVVGTTLGLFEARRQKAFADDQRSQAEKRLSQVQRLNNILGAIFQDLNPENARSDDKPLSAVLGERLDRATAEIEGEATGDPLAVAQMQMILGVSQSSLGYPNRGIALLSKARATFTARLGPDHHQTIRSMHNLASSYFDSGQNDRALPLREETLALARSKLGPDHPDTFTCMVDLADSYLNAGQNDQATKLFEETLALMKSKLGPDDPETFRCMHLLAHSYSDAGQNDRAMTLLEEALALTRSKRGPDHPETLGAMNNLANIYSLAGRNDRALKLREETLALTRTKLGPDHPQTLTCMSNLASSYSEVGQNDRALKLREELLPLARTKLGPDHPETLRDMRSLANSYRQTGQYGRATKLLEETLPLLKSKLGPDHPDTLAGIRDIAVSYYDAGQYSRALELFEEGLELMRRKLGPDHPDTLNAALHLATGYYTAGKHDRATKLLEETLPLLKSKQGPDHPDTLRGMGSLANSYYTAGQNSRAMKLYEETLTLMKTKFGPDHPYTLSSMTNLAHTYSYAGQNDRAMKVYEETLALWRSKLGPDHPETLANMHSLAICYGAAGQNDRALKLYEETLPLMRSKLGPDHPQNLECLESQARCLANSGQIDRASAILDEVIASRRKTQGDGQPRTPWARLARAELDLARGRLDVAEAADRAILDDCRTRLGPDDQVTTAAGLALARVRAARGDRDAAAPLYRAALESARRNPVDRWTLATALTESGRSRLDAGDWAVAETRLREALAIREAEMPQRWFTAEARSLLGGALLGQKKTAEAGPLLRSGYEGMAKQAAAIPLVDRPRLAEALDRLIAAGEAAGSKTEVETWKVARAKLDVGADPKPGSGGK